MRLCQCLIVSRLGASRVYRLASARPCPPRQRRARTRHSQRYAIFIGRDGARPSRCGECENRSPVFALLSTADGILRGVVRAMVAFVCRQDGGAPSHCAVRHICVAAVSHVKPRRADGESCACWVTSRPPAAGTSQEGHGESAHNRWRDIANRKACRFSD